MNQPQQNNYPQNQQQPLDPQHRRAILESATLPYLQKGYNIVSQMEFSNVLEKGKK